MYLRLGGNPSVCNYAFRSKTVSVSEGSTAISLDEPMIANGYYPIFASGAAVSVSENSRDTVYTANASQLTAPIKYAISDGVDKSLFSVTEGGLLTFKSPPDYENPTDDGKDNVYDVEIIATGSASKSAAQFLAVTVTNVVSEDTTGPVFTSAGTATFQENATGTVYTAAATDDTATVTYTLTGGADQSLFSLTAAGVLTFKSSPDFEKPGDAGTNNVYDVIITASDGVSPANKSTKAVAITVTNDTEDDPDPHATAATITDANGTPLTNGSSTVVCGEAPVGGSILCDVTLTGTFAGGSGGGSTEVDIDFEPAKGVSNTLYERLQQFSLWNLIGISNAVAVGPGDFTVDTANPFTITNGSTETFTIRFTPTQVGPSDGVVVLTFSDGSVFRFTITGNGTVATPTGSNQPQNIPVFGPSVCWLHCWDYSGWGGVVKPLKLK